MLFSSIVFLFLFLPIVFAIYFLVSVTRKQLRNFVLVVASLFFYAWGEQTYVLILVFSIICNHFAGYSIYYLKKKNSKADLYFLIGAVVLNLGILGFYKYFNFLSQNIFTKANYKSLHPIGQIINSR